MDLFSGEPRGAPTPTVGPARPEPRYASLALRLPSGVRVGTSSWSFPGWHGIVYDRAASQAALAREGLAAYAAHPLLRAVGVDRTYYRPLTAEDFREYADAVPAGFRFLVKADRLVTSPVDPRPGGIRGPNPRFLDVDHAAREVLEPTVSGLGEKAGPVLFQFSPMGPAMVGGTKAFAERVYAFLSGLPQGPLYAVELRTPALLTRAYRDALQAAGAAHCYTVHPAMTPLEQQLETLPAFRQPALVIRWMLRAGLTYEGAKDRYEPFDRLVDEDVHSRETIATAVLDALVAERGAFVIVNNKAEGSAPLSAFRLAERIVEWKADGGRTCQASR